MIRWAMITIIAMALAAEYGAPGSSVLFCGLACYSAVHAWRQFLELGGGNGQRG